MWILRKMEAGFDSGRALFSPFFLQVFITPLFDSLGLFGAHFCRLLGIGVNLGLLLVLPVVFFGDLHTGRLFGPEFPLVHDSLVELAAAVQKQ